MWVATEIVDLDSKVKSLPDNYVGFLIDGGYTVDEALAKFERVYGYAPEKAYKWRAYLIVPRTDTSRITGLTFSSSIIK
jgi:hypothetical protein